MPSEGEGLDRGQRQVVGHADGPLLVTGGPGSGRTHALVHRFAALVERGHRPDALALVAPARRVAAQVRAQVEADCDAPYDDLWVGTPPELARRLLREHAIVAGLDAASGAVSAADRLALLLDHIDELTLRRHEIRGNPGPLLAAFIARIDLMKAHAIGPDDFQSFAEGLAAAATDDAQRARADRELEFAGVYASHERLVGAAGALDSGEIVLRATTLLHEHPDVRAAVSERLPHVLVDAWDELSFAEGVLVRLLVAEHRNLTATAADRAARAFGREFPEGQVVRLRGSHRSPRRVVAAAAAAADAPIASRSNGGGRSSAVRFWRCRTERAQAQTVAAEAERLTIRERVPPSRIGILVPSVDADSAHLASALEERALPFRTLGPTALFRRAEVRDVLAWLRLLADPGDARAVVRALSRPPIELPAVDMARLTQHARRRKLDMVSGVAAACEGPQLSPEGRERAFAFLKLHRAASGAFDDLRPDAFVHRLIDRIGVRRRQLFAAPPESVERLRSLARLSELAAAYAGREPGASARDFARYAAAVAEAGLPDEEAAGAEAGEAVAILSAHDARGLEFDWVLIAGLGAGRALAPAVGQDAGVPPELARPATGEPADHDAGRAVLGRAMTRARRGVVLSWAESASSRPSAGYEAARTALGAEEEVFEERLFGPAEGLHSTFRILRDDLLDTVSRLGGRLGEMRLDTYLDVSDAVARYLELIKVAALIDRTRRGEAVDHALPEVNELLLQAATPAQRELLETSALDDYLRDTERDEHRRTAALADRSEPSLESFIPRRGDGLMLSASDIETYRLCPLKYKFARVFRIPQEPTINQRFGIVVHQVLERFHAAGGGSLDTLMELFEASWRRAGFADSNDDQQFRARAVEALRRYWELDRERPAEPVAFERPFSFKLGPHLLRGRVDRVDRLPDGRHELMDYKTGAPKTEAELREDVQLSIYQMGARDSWGLETAAQSYYYVLDNRKVPVAHSEHELDRVRATVVDIADGIMAQQFEPTPSPTICSFCDYRIICPAAET